MRAATGESSHSKTATGNVEEDSRRLFTGLTLMPCGLYIWLAARLSLYPPVWLITWRRVSTWNREDTQTKGPVRQKPWLTKTAMRNERSAR